MLVHLMRLLERSAEAFPGLLGGNWLSLVLPLVLFLLTEGHDLIKGGWAYTKAKVKKHTLMLVAVYVLLFVGAVVYTTYRDHIDLAKNSQRNQQLFEGERLKNDACDASFDKANLAIADKQDLIDTLEKAFVASQGPQQQQAANIASCITNLAKMNPAIRERIDVIQVPLGSVDVLGRFPISIRTPHLPSVVPRHYVTELLVITNEPERNFRGVLKCSTSFEFADPPVIPTDALTVMFANNPPVQIDETSYEIRYDAYSAEWNPSHPAYMRVTSSEHLGKCTFTPTE